MAKHILQLGTFPLPLTSLELACISNDPHTVELVLSHKFKPTKDTFNAIFNTFSPLNILTKKCKSRSSAIRISKKQQIKRSKIIDLFISYGYKLTPADIMYATERETLINDISVIKGIETDFITTCVNSNYYPYAHYKLTPTIDCLEIACSRQETVTEIKKIIGAGIKPNMKCLHIACSLPNNSAVIKYLINTCKLVPDADCLRIIGKTFGGTINLMLNAYCDSV